MRLLFIMFLICLIPARGWTGTAMGMQMATAEAAASIKIVQTSLQAIAMTPSTDMAADCPMHANASEAPTKGQPDGGSKACSGCDTCELCLAIASFTAHQFHATPFSPSAALTAVPHGFISADRAIGLKPPIS